MTYFQKLIFSFFLKIDFLYVELYNVKALGVFFSYHEQITIFKHLGRTKVNYYRPNNNYQQQYSGNHHQQNTVSTWERSNYHQPNNNNVPINNTNRNNFNNNMYVSIIF